MWQYEKETERRKWQNPESILTELGLKPGFTFMDIGCGDGFFTIPAARIVGPKGKIYGLDANKEAISTIRKRASAEGLTNIELKADTAENNILCQACADIIFFGIVLHDFQGPAQVLKNAARMIKPEGRLVNLDWKKIQMDFGPPFSKRFNEDTASRLIESAGFIIDSVRDSGAYNYIVIARPGPR